MHFSVAPLMAAFWLVPALSQEQGATAGYAAAVGYDFIRDHQNEYLDFLFVVSVIDWTRSGYCFTN
jgi:hypothetical protein